ncbi:MAG: PIG-L family deacetylase [Candidatus Hodarchaeales archaeon]
MSNNKALVVIAHCDDAVLWMGGAIISLRAWEWHIVSMCNNNVAHKIESFEESCVKLGVEKYRALNFRDYQSGGVFSQNNKDDMKTELSELLDDHYDYVFTHGIKEWNEYGHHDNHAEVGLVTKEVSEEKGWRMVYFSYYPIYSTPGLPTVATINSDYYFPLSYSELKSKLELIELFPNEMLSLSGIGYPCPNPEAFNADVLIPPFHKRGIGLDY